MKRELETRKKSNIIHFDEPFRHNLYINIHNTEEYII
uniref:Uncharacterized protein n=1 Tax=Anguilla anguilla TaxID=7936 RepID=A0A0E9VMD2_ANGAN